jgi:4-hydroxy-tetrahydrodipicolinate synthase
MVEAGVRVVTANGNTGEFYALTESEQDRAVELAVDAVDSAAREAGDAGDTAVIGGVGNELPRAIRGARAAASTGAQAVMIHQPVHPYQSRQGWLSYHRAIADAVPALGVVCYVRDPRVSGEMLASLADYCPNVAGVKYAVPDMLAFARVVAAVPEGRLTWVCGLAELWAPFAWPAGATGFTSGLATVAPALALELLGRLHEGDGAAAMKLREQARPLEELRARDANADNVSVLKEALHQLGLCDRAVRAPSSVLSEEDRAAVGQMVKNLG